MEVVAVQGKCYQIWIDIYELFVNGRGQDLTTARKSGNIFRQTQKIFRPSLVRV